MDKKLFRMLIDYRTILLTLIATATVCYGAYNVSNKIIDYRIDKKLVGVQNEILFLNCMFVQTLSKDQRKDAKEMYNTLKFKGVK